MVAKALVAGKLRVGLFDDDYMELVRLAESIQKSINLRGVVGLQRISDLIFGWVKAYIEGLQSPR